MAARPDIIEVDVNELANEVKIYINSRGIPPREFSQQSTVEVSAYFMNSELVVRIFTRHNFLTGNVEAYLEVVKGPHQSLKFKIRYGFMPFHLMAQRQQIFIYTQASRRSRRVHVCKFAALLDFLIANDFNKDADFAEFVSTILVSPAERPLALEEYRIPTVNAADCDHTIICDGREVRVHRRLLMGASRFFHNRLRDHPDVTVTDIGQLEAPMRIDMDTLTALLSFMYGITVSEHNLRTATLLGAAREYEMHGLFNLCQSSMIR